MTKVTIVVENTAARPGLVVEHGLSVWLSHGETTVLYDTGAGRALLPNLAALGLDPGRIDAIVLSHGHYDHTGGLAGLIALRTASGLRTEVWCHRDLFGPHLKQTRDRLGDIGPPRGSVESYQALGGEFCFIDEPTTPWPGITLLAPVPRRTDFEGPAPGLVTTDSQGEVQPDPFLDDLTILVEADSGPVALTGCAHAGVINIVRAAEERLGRPLSILIGGTHLGPAPAAQRERALEELAAHESLELAVGHCTGQAVIRELVELMGERVTPIRGGMTLER